MQTYDKPNVKYGWWAGNARYWEIVSVNSLEHITYGLV